MCVFHFHGFDHHDTPQGHKPSFPTATAHPRQPTTAGQGSVSAPAGGGARRELALRGSSRAKSLLFSAVHIIHAARTVPVYAACRRPLTGCGAATNCSAATTASLSAGAPPLPSERSRAGFLPWRYYEIHRMLMPLPATESRKAHQRLEVGGKAHRPAPLRGSPPRRHCSLLLTCRASAARMRRLGGGGVRGAGKLSARAFCSEQAMLWPHLPRSRRAAGLLRKPALVVSCTGARLSGVCVRADASRASAGLPRGFGRPGRMILAEQ